MHEKMRFDLLKSIQSNADHNEKTCAAEELREAGCYSEAGHECRQNCNNGKEYRSRQCQMRKNIIDIIGSISSRPHARNKAALFLHRIGNIARIECNCRVE